MVEVSAEVRFVRALAAGVLRLPSGEEPPARAAAAALRAALSTQKSLVLDVQFTGFTRRGEAVGGVSPELMRAAQQLIILRVSRLGFTAGAGEGELAALFDLLARTPAQAPQGVVALLREAAVGGVYLSASTGEVYRPVPTASVSAAAPPPEPETARPADEGLALTDFDLVESGLPSVAPWRPREGRGAPPPPPPPRQEEPPPDDLYHFFRTSSASAAAEDEALAGALRAADGLNRFDELAQSVARAVPRLLAAGEEERAVHLLEALVREARRPDRTRVFRDAAVQALRRAAGEELLGRLADLLGPKEELREPVMETFLLLGGDALSVLEEVVLRTGDAALRETAFRALLRADPTGARLLARAMADSTPARARLLLALAGLPGVDPALALRFTERAASHPDGTVRTEAARGAARLGGKGGMRVLVELLGDADRLVRRMAVQGLARLGEPASVPFLARVCNDAADEELQLEAVGALGRVGTAEVLPVLTAVLGRRQLFAGARLRRLKAAAVAALGRVQAPGARELLQSLASGRDAELAAEARRALSSAGG
jgi:hypothetical protein